MKENLLEKKVVGKNSRSVDYYLDTIPDAFIVIDSKLNIIVVNAAFSKVFGYSVKECIGKSVMKLFPKEELPKQRDEMKKARETGKISKFESVVICKKKVRIPVEIYGSAIKKNGDVEYVAIFRDITERKKAEKELRKIHEQLQVSISSMPLAYILWDNDFNVVEWNKSAERIFGYTREEVLGKPAINFIVPKEAMGKVREVIRNLKVGEIASYSEKDNNIRKDGKKISCLWYNTPLKYNSGKVVGIISIVEDVTEKMEGEAALKESEEKYRTQFVSSVDSMMTLDPPSWRFTSGNPAIVKMFGVMGEKEFITLGPSDVSPKYQEDGQLSSVKAKKMIMQAMKEGSNFFEWTHRKLDGTNFYATVLLTKIKVKGKDILQATVRDITKQKKAERALIKEKNRAENYLDITGSIIVTLDNDGIITLLNKKGYETLEYPEGSLVGNSWIDLFIPKDKLAGIVAVHKRNVSESKKFLEHSGNEIVTKSGKRLFISWHNSLIKDIKGKVVGTLSSGEDITEKRKSEQALKESEEKFRYLSETIDIGIFIHEKGRLIEANSRFYKMFKYNIEDFKGKDLIPLIVAPESLDMVNEHIAKNILGSYEFLGMRKDGSNFPADAHVQTIKYRGSDARIVAVVDITEKKKAEDDLKKLNQELDQRVKERTLELKKSEEKYSVIVETSPTGIFETEVGGKIKFMNRYLLDFFGYKSLEEVQKLKVVQFYEDEERRKKLINELKTKGKVSNFEILAKRKGGARTILVNARLNDGMIRGTFLDISQRKVIEQELELANKELKQLDVAKTDFLNMISHELKTPLTSMMAHLDVLGDVKSECINQGVEKRQCGFSYDAIKRGNFQLNLLIDNLLEVARMQAKTFKLDSTEFNTRELVLEVVNDLLPSATQKGLKVKYSLPKELVLKADRNRVREILNNLINNSIKFTNKGEIVIRASSDGKVVSISIKDTGVGIKKEDMPNLFKKFFQVERGLKRGASRGTGLGLTIVNKLTQLHGGKVFAKSQFGKGSTFTVKLPAGGIVKKVKENMKESSKNHQSDFVASKNMKGVSKTLQSKNVTKTNSLKGGTN